MFIFSAAIFTESVYLRRK